MTVKTITQLRDPKYKPIVDIIVEAIEDTVPDSIDELKLSTLIDFYPEKHDPEGRYDALKVCIYIGVTGWLHNSRGIPWEIASRRIGYSLRIESAFLDSPEYPESIRHTAIQELADILLNIIKFSKTGEMANTDDMRALQHFI